LTVRWLKSRALSNRPANGKANGKINSKVNGKARSNGSLIELNSVSKTYSTAAGEFVALQDVDLRIDKGEFISIVGKSGSGKTTLINVLTGIDQPSGGSIFVDGTAVHDLKVGQRAEWRGRTMGVVFQFFQLLPTLNLLENVRIPMDFGGMYEPGERDERALHLLSLVGLEDHAHDLPAQLSGGQQQSAAIARALANDPPIIATDEPTGNLDSASAENVIGLFEELVTGGKTILMVTHDEDLARRASRTIALADGRIISGAER
jgi:putative ABC transport system ATP-binding protein